MKKILSLLIVLGIIGFSGCEKDNYISDITLSETNIVINTGESKDLVASFSPEDAVNNVLTWMSDDVEVATVSNGKVIGIGYGETTIKVKDSTNKIIKNCKVKVNVKDYTWDGTIPEEKPDTLKVKDDKETYKLDDGREVAMEVIEINNLNEFIYFFQKMKIEDIAKTSTVLIRIKHDFYLGGNEWKTVNILNKVDDYNYCIIIDGNMKKIVDFKCTGDNAALFNLNTNGYLQIKDVKIEKASINTTRQLAGVINCNDTGNVSYKGCEINKSNVSGTKYVGGIAAYGGASSFVDCKVKDTTIKVNPNNTTFNIGGLVGLNNAGSISGCVLENVNMTQIANSLQENAKRVGIISGVLQSEVTIDGDITIKNCLINGIKVSKNEQVVFLDNRSSKDYSKIKIT